MPPLTRYPEVLSGAACYLSGWPTPERSEFVVKFTHIVPSMLALLALAACTDKELYDPGSEDSGSDGSAVTYDDADGDTILDIHEGEEDPDGDGTPNILDEDSDEDTIKDAIEAGDDDPLTLPFDSDGDGTSDFLDTDSDNNCIDDKSEKNPTGDGPGDTDDDGTADYADDDNDGDGILDTDEIGGSCENPDSDGDGTPDYMDLDSDGDGIGDVYEAGTTAWETEPADTDGDGTPDYLDSDSDGDGISDSEEGGVSSIDEEPRDTDGDGRPDFQDTDSDGDSLSDAEEVSEYGTDPYDPDSDGDGFSDGGEVTAGTDPLDSSSVIDGIYVEVSERTDVEENFQFELRIEMGDIGFLIDTTGSMSGTGNAMASEFGTIVSDLTSTIPDAQYGFGTYDDYATSPYGDASSGDKPYELHKQITDNTTGVASALSSGICCHYGGDGPESSMEALYQGLTGNGYDMNCNGSFDSRSDVRPFLSSSGDAFGGGGGEAYSSSSSGGGSNGGMGFRDYSLPVLIFATDYDLRDPDNGYPSPGGCTQDAGQGDVVVGASDLGAYIVGVHVNNYTNTPYNQMQDLAQATGSYADTDGDGSADDLLVFKWSGSNSSFRSTITGAIEDLVSSIKFDQVSLEIDGDEWGFVTAIDPEYYEDFDPNAESQELDFTLTFRGVVAANTEDQLFKLTLNVVGDGTVLLDSLDIIVLVPGSSY